MLLYHASKEIVEYPEIRKTKYTKDFSWGFYCTRDIEQARRWAIRGTGEGQVSFHTLRALDCIHYVGNEVAHE